MTKIKYKKTKCPICGTLNNYKILYKRNFKESDLNIEIFSARRLPDRKHYQIVKCLKCGLVRSNPITDSKFLEKLYQKSVLTYDGEIKNLVDTYFQSIKPILEKLPKTANILEIGCGNGFVLEKIYQSGYKNVFGIEPSVNAVNKAPKSIKNKIVVNMFKTNLFPKNKFDLIFLFQTLDHISNPNEFIKECHHITKKGGYFLAFNHNIESFSAKILKDKNPIIDIEHTVLYSPQTAKLFFEKNGYQVKQVYSPNNILSIKHLFWLLPIPNSIKHKIIEYSSPILKQKIKLKLGNLCLIAQK
jgi:SAM-dependent methyltransferase